MTGGAGGWPYTWCALDRWKWWLGENRWCKLLRVGHVPDVSWTDGSGGWGRTYGANCWGLGWATYLVCLGQMVLASVVVVAER